MIKQLLNSVAAKYRDQLATEKLRYFARPRPITVKYSPILKTARIAKKM